MEAERGLQWYHPLHGCRPLCHKVDGNSFMGIILACAPVPDLMKLVANQWLVRGLHCIVQLLDFWCNTAIFLVYFWNTTFPLYVFLVYCWRIAGVLLAHFLCIAAQAVVVVAVAVPLDTMIGLQSGPGRLSKCKSIAWNSEKPGQ